MKHLYNIFTAAILVLSFASCQSVIETVKPSDTLPEGRFVIKASIKSNSGTKLALDESNGKLYWTSDDVLSVYAGAGSGGGVGFELTANAESSTATFTGALDPSTLADGDYFYGFYPWTPYNEVKPDGTIRLAVSNGCQPFDFEDKVLTGFKSIPHYLPYYGQGFPMIARSTDENFSFHNVCGGIKVTVAHEGLMGVIIKNNDGSPMWGMMNLEFGPDGVPVFKGMDSLEQMISLDNDFEEMALDEFWLMDNGTNYDYFLSPGEPYYVVLPPITFSQGMTVTYRTPSTSATYTVNSSFDIRASVFSQLTERDKDLEFKPIEGNIAFSNSNFKQYCVENFDSDGDGEISYAEALTVTKISIADAAAMGDPDMDLMYFENLETFIFRGTSNNRGPLQSFPNYWFPKLKELDLTCNSIHNPMEFTANPLLETLYVQGNDRLSSVNLSANSNLKNFYGNNTALGSLDLSACPDLEYLYCARGQLSSLDLSANNKLRLLQCASNQLSSLDVRGLEQLDYLSCAGNAMSQLTLGSHPALETLYCYDNGITSLDLSGCPSLTLLSCYNNNLSSLDLSANTLLQKAYVSYNPLGTLDVSRNTGLIHLFCCINNLKSVDVSNNEALEYFRCFGNDIESLDLSHNPELTEIVFGGNPMTSLDVSNNPKLYYFDAVYDEDWNDYRVKYNTYTSPLKYLYIAEGQSIPEVTYDRLDATIPFATIVGTRTAIEAGHPHQDVLTPYTMTAYTETAYSDGNWTIEERDWDVTVSEYEGDVTKVWLEPLCLLVSQNQDLFSSKIYAIVRGDGNGFYIPLPQKIGTDASSIFNVTAADMYYYTWTDTPSTGGYHFITDDDAVLFSAQDDGTLKADKSFGLAIDRVNFYMYEEPVYMGMVNHSTETQAITLKKK